MSKIDNTLVLASPAIAPVSAAARSSSLRFERRNSRGRRFELESRLKNTSGSRLGRILDVRA